MTSIGSMSLLLLRRALRPFGLDLRRMGGAAPWLPANPAMDPVTYLYFVDLRHVPAIRIDIDRARLGVVALPYNMACANPFALAFEAAFGARDEAAARSMVEAILSAYYESVQPADACAALDVTPDEAPGLRDLPAPDTIVCRCEDVTLSELNGCADARSAKLLTRAGMGPCQGRVCGAALRFLRGWDADTVRPPALPATISTMAAAAVSSPAPTSAR